MDLESGTVCDVPQTTGRVIQPFQTVAEDVFIRAVGPQRSVNLFNCAFEMLLLAYFLLSSVQCLRKKTRAIRQPPTYFPLQHAHRPTTCGVPSVKKWQLCRSSCSFTVA